MDFKKKLENLKKNQEQMKEMFIKCQGAIEFVQSIIEEQESSKEEKKK